nr:MAG TPA: hypothetical protein [Caudoviricetes sp.]
MAKQTAALTKACATIIQQHPTAITSPAIKSRNIVLKILNNIVSLLFRFSEPFRLAR